MAEALQRNLHDVGIVEARHRVLQFQLVLAVAFLLYLAAYRIREAAQPVGNKLSFPGRICSRQGVIRARYRRVEGPRAHAGGPRRHFPR